MPPAIQTDMTSEFPEEVSKITTDELVRLSFAALKAGTLEIRPGQTNQGVDATARTRFPQPPAVESVESNGSRRRSCRIMKTVAIARS